MKMSYLIFKTKFAVKKLKNKLLGIRDLDNDGKIESIREEIGGLFSQFVTMRDGINQANQKLQEVVVDELEKQKTEQERLEAIIARANEQLNVSSERVARAENEINANERLKAKVSEFIAE